MGAQSTVAFQPAQLIRAPSGFGLWYRITVTNVAAFLPALLPGSVLPTIPVANISGPAGIKYAFKFVDIQAEADPALAPVRWTDDGQTAPSATLGFIIPGGVSFIRIPCDPQDIQLIAPVADVNLQVRLGILGLTQGAN